MQHDDASPPEPPTSSLDADAGAAPRVLARNAAWNAASYVLNALTLLIVSPYVVQGLGKDLFGIWVLIQMLTGYMNIADFGIRPAIVHFVAKHDARGELNAISRVVSAALKTLIASAGLVLLAAAVLAPNLPAWFHVDAANASDASTALWITAVAFALQLPLNAFTGVLIGKQRFDLTCRIDLFSMLASTIGIIAVLYLKGGIIGLALVIGLVELIEMLVKSKFAFREVPSLRIGWRAKDGGIIRALLAYGGFNVLVGASSMLVDRTDALVIGARIGTKGVTFYDRAAKLPMHTRMFVSQIGRVLMPEFGARDARNDREGVVRLLVTGSRNVLLIAGPIVAYLVVLGGAFLQTWMHGDAEFRIEGHLPLVLLAITVVFPIAAYPLLTAHQGTNRMRSLAVFSAIEGVANLAISLALVGEHGLVGVAIGTAIPAVIIHGLVLPWWNGRHYGMRLSTYLLSVWPIPLIAGGATYGLLAWVFGRADHLGWIPLIGGGLLAVTFFGGVAGVLMRATGTSLRPDPIGASPEVVS